MKFDARRELLGRVANPGAVHVIGRAAPVRFETIGAVQVAMAGRPWALVCRTAEVGRWRLTGVRAIDMGDWRAELDLPGRRRVALQDRRLHAGLEVRGLGERGVGT